MNESQALIIIKIKSKLTKLKDILKRLPHALGYFINKARGKVPQELELSTMQKIWSLYILPGTQYVRSPKGYFHRESKNLRVIDDVATQSQSLWMNHRKTTTLPPKLADGEKPVDTIWSTPLASFILSVRNGFVGPSGVVFNAESLIRNAKWYYEPPPDFLPVVHFKKIITFIQLWGHIFTHFVFDTLPRLGFALEFVCRQPDMHILVPHNPLVIEVFKSVGVNRSRMVLHKRNHMYSADTVYYPHFYNKGFSQKMGLVPRGSLVEIQTQLRGDQHVSNDHVVYLTRRNNSTRNVANEDKLLSAIKERLERNYTLKVFEPSNDWRKDRKMIKRARVVLGPHGGAWCNIIFCKNGTDVIEFLPLIALKKAGKNERPCYYGLANALNLNYWVVEPDRFHFEKPGMHVPVGKVIQVLEKIGVLASDDQYLPGLN